MCFTIYIGCTTPLPQILWDNDHPQFNTKYLEDWEENVKRYFSYPDVIYAGSAEGCGCGFRHALLSHGDWLPVISNEQKEIDNERKNHQDLFDFITSYVKEGKIEILACWNGEVGNGVRSVQNISISDLIKEDFYFKEDSLYTVVL